MKTLILVAVLALSSLGAMSNDTKESRSLSYRASQNLIFHFGEVTHVQWSPAMNDMIRADFNIDEESISAFFSSDGEFIASTRGITRHQLPLKLRMEMGKKIGDAEVIYMFELNSPQEHAYFIETRVDGKKKVWKGFDYGALAVYKVDY